MHLLEKKFENRLIFENVISSMYKFEGKKPTKFYNFCKKIKINQTKKPKSKPKKSPQKNHTHTHTKPYKNPQHSLMEQVPCSLELEICGYVG